MRALRASPPRSPLRAYVAAGVAQSLHWSLPLVGAVGVILATAAQRNEMGGIGGAMMWWYLIMCAGLMTAVLKARKDPALPMEEPSTRIGRVAVGILTTGLAAFLGATLLTVLQVVTTSVPFVNALFLAIPGWHHATCDAVGVLRPDWINWYPSAAVLWLLSFPVCAAPEYTQSHTGIGWCGPIVALAFTGALSPFTAFVLAATTTPIMVYAAWRAPRLPPEEAEESEDSDETHALQAGPPTLTTGDVIRDSISHSISLLRSDRAGWSARGVVMVMQVPYTLFLTGSLVLAIVGVVGVVLAMWVFAACTSIGGVSATENNIEALLATPMSRHHLLLSTLVTASVAVFPALLPFMALGWVSVGHGIGLVLVATAFHGSRFLPSWSWVLRVLLSAWVYVEAIPLLTGVELVGFVIAGRFALVLLLLIIVSRRWR